MARLTDWIIESEKYEFCRSYGVSAEGEFVERQEDYYISLLGNLHDFLTEYYKTDNPEEIYKVKRAMLGLVKGILLYSQKETANEFHGVTRQNNQLYVAAIYYLCDYSAVAAWVMSDLRMDVYEDETAQLLSFIVTGGRSARDRNVRLQYLDVFKLLEDYIFTGEEKYLKEVVTTYNSKYERHDFDSPTDFYMTCVLRCVLKKFSNDNVWLSLRKVDVEFDWKEYVRHSYRQNILSFLPSQQDAIDKGLLSFIGAFSLKMPTSAGKSYITELLIYHELRRNANGRVLYLAPLRALSRELRDRFRRIHKGLGITYATKYGGSAASVVEDTLDEAQLLIATPESFMSIESKDDDTLGSFTLVICDEGQLLDDYSRGINYEMLLSRLRKQEQVRFLFISAIIPNIEVVNRWLKGNDEQIGDSTYRPSKLVLVEALADDDKVDLNVYKESHDDISYTISHFITKADAQDEELRRYDAKNRKWILGSKAVGCTLALRSLSAGSVLLFTTSKTTGVSCTTLAKHLINMLNQGGFDTPKNYVSNQQELDALIEYTSYLLGKEHLLCHALIYGFAFHHGDIPQELREKIERAYDRGIIRLIISNNTLAEGVNLPIKTIILAYAMDQGRPGMYLPNTRLKNIIGRVGRAGRERYGTIIVPTVYRNGYLIKLVKEALSTDDSQLDKIRGTLYDLIDFLVRKKIINSEDDVNQLLSVTMFSDAIDEMIVRSSDDDLRNLDVDAIVTNSLAYTLSDENKKDALKKVFGARYNVLNTTTEDNKYQILKATGLNLRELEYVEAYMTTDKIAIATSVANMLDNDFVSLMIDCVMGLPSVKDSLQYDSKKRQKLMADVERLKLVALFWMKGLQFHEIATEISTSVDEAILIVMYLQGTVHDKATKILAYLKETNALDNQITLYWPDYLRIGIYSRLMYEFHKLRISERIQLHALAHYYIDNGYGSDMYNSLGQLLINEKEDIYNYMRSKGYPYLTIVNLVETIEYFERNDE